MNWYEIFKAADLLYTSHDDTCRLGDECVTAANILSIRDWAREEHYSEFPATNDRSDRDAYATKLGFLKTRACRFMRDTEYAEIA